MCIRDRIGSAQYRKKGAFLQHGEIQLNPPRELWIKLFGEEPPNQVDLSLNKEGIIKYLMNAFLETKSNLKIKTVTYKEDDIKNLM